MAQRQTGRGKGELDNADLKFYYSKKGRLSLPSAPNVSKRGKWGFLKGNRTLIILFLDIAVICLLIFFYRFVLYTPSYNAELSGFWLELDSHAIGDGLVGILRVENRTADVPEGRIYARFYSGDQDLRLSKELPTEKKSSIELTARLYGTGSERQIFVEAQVGEQTVIISKKLEPQRD